MYCTVLNVPSVPRVPKIPKIPKIPTLLPKILVSGGWSQAVPAINFLGPCAAARARVSTSLDACCSYSTTPGHCLSLSIANSQATCPTPAPALARAKKYSSTDMHDTYGKYSVKCPRRTSTERIHAHLRLPSASAAANHSIFAGGGSSPPPACSSKSCPSGCARSRAPEPQVVADACGAAGAAASCPS